MLNRDPAHLIKEEIEFAVFADFHGFTSWMNMECLPLEYRESLFSTCWIILNQVITMHMSLYFMCLKVDEILNSALLYSPNWLELTI